MKRLLFFLIVLAAAAGCAPDTPRSQVEVLPTLAVLNPIPTRPPEDAERTARAFLEAWKAGDFAAMHSLMTFNSQEATPQEAFTALYQASHNEMTLNSLDYTATTLYRERDNIVTFAYDVTFDTNLLGQFTNADRALRLVVDERVGEWRVAWSPADIFAEMGSGARLRLEVSPPSRTNIYDRDGEILADQNGRAVIVSAIKRNIPAWDSCKVLLTPLLGKNEADIQKIYDDSSPDWLMELGVIEASAYDQQHEQLEQICAAQFSSRPSRRYQNGTLAPHVLGNIGYPDKAALPAVREAGFSQDSILGKSGIELSWDETLRGRPGGRLLIVSQGGGVLREITRSPSKPPESVWLTLDSQFQADVAAIIAKAYADKKWSQSKGAAAVVMDVHTGAILAMVSYPTYDGNAFSPFPTMGREAAAKIVAQIQADTSRPQLNRAVNGLYPLGSVMKTVSATAVADTGVYDLDERYLCTGIWTRDITRYDWKPGGHGLLTLPMALTQSSNPYFYEVGYQMNLAMPGVLPQYMEKVGFGHPTGLRDLQESPGFIPNPDWKRKNFGVEWNFSDEVNIAVGQGEVQVTPLQVTRWFAAIANGGTLLRPQLVQQVGILGEAPSYTLDPEAMEQLDIKPEVFTMLREGLCAVTQSPAGTAEYQFKHSPLQRIGVCGKTGTAQTGGTDTISHAWFAAWAPMNNPEIAIAVIVENAGEGSGEAAPIVRDILEEYFFGEDAPESTGLY